MLYQLPEPLYEQTHVTFYEIIVNPGQSVRLTGNMGTLDANDEFIPSEDFGGGWFVRTIAGDEFQAFLDYIDSQRAGAPTEGTSNLRDADLGYWLTVHGARESTWTAE